MKMFTVQKIWNKYKNFTIIFTSKMGINHIIQNLVRIKVQKYAIFFRKQLKNYNYKTM
jgi:hypothetical protein